MFCVSNGCLRVAKFIAIGGLLLAIGGCSSALEKALSAGDPKEDVAESVSGADLTARFPAPTSNRLRDGLAAA